MKITKKKMKTKIKFDIPEGYSEETRKCVENVAAYLIDSDRWNDYNVSLLIIYMKAFEEFMRLSEHLDKEGMIIERHGEKIANPAFKKQSMAIERVLFASRLLRITPLSKQQPPISFN